MENKKIYVVGGSPHYANWTGMDVVDQMTDADLVMFTGGEDVDPSLYNEPKHSRTYSNLARDDREAKEFRKAKELGKPMIGICRGSQFLCVMNGGKLVQHQENPLPIHPIYTTYGKINITSTHHQAAYPYELKPFEYHILGWTFGVSRMHEDGNGKEMNPSRECEIVYYPRHNCLGIQGHPEMTIFQRENLDSMIVLKRILNDFMNRKLINK